MDNREYSLGLFGTITLECGEDGKYYCHLNRKGKKFLLVCDINDKSMKLMKKQKGIICKGYIEVKKIERNIIKQLVLNEDGSRWEGGGIMRNRLDLEVFMMEKEIGYIVDSCLKE